MTTYLGEKAVGIGTIKATTTMSDVLHDNTLNGNGSTEPLGVNIEVIATKDDLAKKADTTAIPTKTSQLENDSGFLTQHQDISGKADKVKTVALTTSTVELATNTIYNAGEMAALTITFPTTDETYISQLNFTSGATATAFTAPDTIKWVGDDVTDGAFIPATNKRYAIMFYSDGTNIRGAVQGVA